MNTCNNFLSHPYRRSDTEVRLVPHPSSQTKYQLSSLSRTQDLWNDLGHQTDEVYQLVILQNIVLMHDLPQKC